MKLGHLVMGEEVKRGDGFCRRAMEIGGWRRGGGHDRWSVSVKYDRWEEVVYVCTEKRGL